MLHYLFFLAEPKPNYSVAVYTFRMKRSSTLKKVLWVVTLIALFCQQETGSVMVYFLNRLKPDKLVPSWNQTIAIFFSGVNCDDNCGRVISLERKQSSTMENAHWQISALTEQKLAGNQYDPAPC